MSGDDGGIRVEAVSRAFGDVQAVDGVSFEVRPGEVVGLLGPNGAGKTTTLRMMATLLKPDAGRIEIDGLDVQLEPLAVRARIGYLTGETGLYERLNPVEFLRYFGQLADMPAERLEARVEHLVESVGITDFAERLCGTLSTGQKQRVSIARALLNEPPVLILDEPTSGLDIVSSQFILDALEEAARAGCAVLFSTHIMSEIELICDRVVVLHLGRVLASGALSELLELTGEAQLSRAFLHLIREADAEEPTP